MSFNSANAGFRWTNHALVDMGIASLMVFADRRTPDELTREDLEEFARFAEVAYFSPELASALTVLFTVNFISPSFTLAKKQRFVRTLLRSFETTPDKQLPPCAFCAGLAVRIAHRDLVPLISGRLTLNFFTGLQTGLPLCGKCLIALQALSIGAPVVSGKVLVIACDDPQITIEFVRCWQREIRKRIQLSMQSGRKPAPITKPLTRTVETLQAIEMHIPASPASLTVYYFSNSGQGPNISIYALEPVVLCFLKHVSSSTCGALWHELVNQAWEGPPESRTAKLMEHNVFRNALYEDLYGLPEGAPRFVWRYFRKTFPHLLANGRDPLDSWNLVDLFLKEIVAMDAGRIDAAVSFGDSLATTVLARDDRKLWHDIWHADSYRASRSALIQARKRGADPGARLPIALEGFLRAFVDVEGPAPNSWEFAWDLVVIRVIGKLFQLKWFDKNQDVLAEIEQHDDIQA